MSEPFVVYMLNIEKKNHSVYFTHRNSAKQFGNNGVLTLGCFSHSS